MKLTKELETEILSIYNAYWEAYLKGDMKHFANMLDEDLSVFGTAISEVFNNKEEAVGFYNATAEQMVGKVDFRNRHYIVQPVGDAIFIREQNDLYVLLENEWSFYGHARITAVFRQRKGDWKLVHQHASFPDNKAGEGEQIAAEKIKQENLELREAVKRRTVELEYKNRELEIEAALERVRSRTMAMHSSNDLLLVIDVLKDQLQQLRFELDAVNFITDLDLNGYQMWLATPGGTILQKVFIPRIEYRGTRMLEEAVRNRSEMVSYVLTKEEKDTYFRNFFENPALKEIPEPFRRQVFDQPGMAISLFPLHSIVLTVANFKAIPLTEEQNSIIRRFANVFEQSYTRFLDLQKAEAQAREAQIELSLERVRTRTMIMQKSEELVETSVVLFQELRTLGVKAIRTGVAIIDDEKELMELWSSQLIEQRQNKVLGIVPMHAHPFFEGLLNAWRQNDTDFIYVFEGEKVKEFYQAMSSFITYPAQDHYNPFEVFSPFFFPEGSLTVVSHNTLSDEERKIMQRFARVFGLLYRRFHDLQKAEAQAREAQIEAALERVRARSMAMYKTDELLEAAELVSNELSGLGIKSMNVSYAFVDEDEQYASYYSLNPVDNKIPPFPFVFPHTETDEMRSILASWKKQEPFHVIELDEEATLIHQIYIGKLIQEIFAKNKIDIPFSVDAFLEVSPKKAVLYTFNFKNGYLFNIGGQRLTTEQEVLLLRFTKVFEQTYTRFLDLQKAEAQAKESQVEAALERVRSRTMGMQKSEELKEVIKVVYDQFVHLNIHIEHTGFVMDYKARDDYNIWVADPLGVPSQVTVPYFDSVYYNRFNEAKEKGEDFFATNLSFEEKNRFYEKLFEFVPGLTEEAKKFYFSCPGLAASTVLLENIGLYIENFSGTPYTEEENKTLMRFGKVFQQTYTRFLDLQKAETQAREAQIEAALERVRSRSMAMHKSDELKEIIIVVSDQLQKLGYKFSNVTFVTHNANYDLKFWMSAQGVKEPFLLHVPYLNNPVVNNLKHAVENDIWFSTAILTADESLEWNQHVIKTTWLKDAPQEIKNYLLRHTPYAITSIRNKHIAFAIGNYAGIPYKDEENEVFKRFANVFEQSYTRFLDLQKAEAQAREAQIEASLERVRGKAMAMHSSHDLADTISAFYNELQSFSITPRRCGVGLLNKETRIAELSTMNTTDAGDSIEIIGTVKMADHPILDGVYENWLLQKEYHPVLRGAEIPAYYRLLKPQITFPDYPEDAVQYGYFFFFPEGGVYAWTEKEMTKEELIIYRRFTSVLSLSYKRYKDLQQAEDLARQAEEDLKNLKVEKKRTEDALTELKNTQSQLIQSEKMASLGELTAGIAHEIQNPLNFVNNFSEVSNELLDEMLQEVARGNYEEVKSIVDDVKQNLEKIHHHGKRADGIVKGMLLHSRVTSNTKEPSDINVLADEYLRLAYHGLRAKDKSFNVTLETDYDKNIGKINIIPQDIGRVVLNLINNAFYAVDEKNKRCPEGYIPTISVSTKRINDKVEICVADNGNGIPQNVVDKIFQPFFTTKPTGQGTGLGLSLSYDIAKAHGGELTVETKEGAGTGFIVTIPIG